MESEEPQDRGRRKGGHYCIAPGCKNEFYRVKAKRKKIHFHTLPVKRSAVLLSWLAALKRETRPKGTDPRVCSDHFVEEDYIEEKTFESDRLVVRRTNRLKPEAIPSVFTADDSSSADRPAHSDNNGAGGSDRRREKAVKHGRKRQAGMRQVGETYRSRQVQSY